MVENVLEIVYFSIILRIFSVMAKENLFLTPNWLIHHFPIGFYLFCLKAQQQI